MESLTGNIRRRQITYYTCTKEDTLLDFGALVPNSTTQCSKCYAISRKKTTIMINNAPAPNVKKMQTQCSSCGLTGKNAP